MLSLSVSRHATAMPPCLALRTRQLKKHCATGMLAVLKAWLRCSSFCQIFLAGGYCASAWHVSCSFGGSENLIQRQSIPLTLCHDASPLTATWRARSSCNLKTVSILFFHLPVTAGRKAPSRCGAIFCRLQHCRMTADQKSRAGCNPRRPAL